MSGMQTVAYRACNEQLHVGHTIDMHNEQVHIRRLQSYNLELSTPPTEGENILPLYNCPFSPHATLTMKVFLP